MCEESLLILILKLSLLHQGRCSIKTPEPLCCTRSPNDTESTQFPALCLTESFQRTDRSSRHGGNTESASVQLCMTLCRPCHVRFVSYHVFILWDLTGPNTEYPTSFANVCRLLSRSDLQTLRYECEPALSDHGLLNQTATAFFSTHFD